MNKITTWKRYDDANRRWEFNHIEDGHVQPEQQYPLPKVDCKAQHNWKKAAWIKCHAYLVDGVVRKDDAALT